MTAFSPFVRLLAILPLAVVLSGCFLPNEGPVDEEKDPHFLAGKNRVTSLDYDGAIVAFENALTSNPKNASAHLELGLLYEERKADYGAAIYHFEKHLELRPESRMAETVKQHIMACRLEIARTVSFLLVNRQVQDELRRLYTTNSWLREQNLQLKNQITEQGAAFSNRLAQVSHAAAEARAAAQAPVQAQAQSPAKPTYQGSSYYDPDPRPTYYTERSTPPSPSTRATSTRATSTAPASRSTPRSSSQLPEAHVVKSGETMATIAKRYNIKLSALHIANPGVEDRPLRSGQILNLPSGRN